MTDLEIFKKLAELKKQDIAVCLVTIIETTGSTPREVGAKMIICVDGATYGSIGGGCGENQARSAALRSTLVTRQPGSPSRKSSITSLPTSSPTATTRRPAWPRFHNLECARARPGTVM